MISSPFPQPNTLSLVRYYGTPWKVISDDKIVLHPRFDRDYITRVPVPFDLFMAGQRIKAVAVHKRLFDSTSEILAQIEKELSPKEMDFFGINQYGGGFNFRDMRGSKGGRVSDLSLHAYGAALDFSPTKNPLGKAYNSAEKMMPLEVIEIFHKQGWVWGGQFKKRPDCMHFQATQ